jgi:hypothetical protein
MGSHERYETLAVGHVLGGLDAAEAAEFRSHLVGCHECRQRVAELRDIDAELAAAEREARSDAQVRTEVERRVVEEAAPPEDFPRELRARRFLGVGALTVAMLVGLLAFWNLHLRTQNMAGESTMERSAATLRALADGVPVAVHFEGNASGLAVIGDDEVAFTFSRLPPLGEGERYVVWLLGSEDGPLPAVIAVGPEQALSGVVASRGADELVVTRESGQLESTPGGDRLIVADLRRASR